MPAVLAISQSLATAHRDKYSHVTIDARRPITAVQYTSNTRRVRARIYYADTTTFPESVAQTRYNNGHRRNI